MLMEMIQQGEKKIDDTRGKKDNCKSKDLKWKAGHGIQCSSEEFGHNDDPLQCVREKIFEHNCFQAGHLWEKTQIASEEMSDGSWR